MPVITRSQSNKNATNCLLPDYYDLVTKTTLVNIKTTIDYVIAKYKIYTKNQCLTITNKYINNPLDIERRHSNNYICLFAFVKSLNTKTDNYVGYVRDKVDKRMLRKFKLPLESSITSHTYTNKTYHVNYGLYLSGNTILVPNNIMSSLPIDITKNVICYI
jgi:hypothetical protein